MIPVDVGVGQHVRELVGHEIGDLRDEVQEDRVLGDVERHAEEQVAGALIHHQRELSVRDEELEQRVARGQGCRVELSRVPGGHDVAAARRSLADAADDVGELIDVPAVRRDPIAPLLTVVPPGVAVEASLVDPVRRVGVAVPDARAEGVQLVHVGAAGDEPEQLGEDRAERQPFRGDRGKAVAHPEAHEITREFWDTVDLIRYLQRLHRQRVWRTSR